MTIKEQLLKRGVLYLTKEDINGLQVECEMLKQRAVTKLVVIAPVVACLFIVTALLTDELMTPRVGDIGAYGPNGESVKLRPTINASPTKELAYNYALKAAINIRTFSFSTYYEDIRALEPYFAAAAFDDFLLSLQSSGLFERVKAESINVTAAKAPDSQINAFHTYVDGTPTFYIRVKLMLRIESLSGEDEFDTEELFLTLTQVDRGISKYGLVISSLEPF